MVAPTNQPSAEAVGQQLQAGDSYIPTQYFLRAQDWVQSSDYQKVQGRSRYGEPESFTFVKFEQKALDEGHIAVTTNDGRTFTCLGHYSGTACLTHADMDGIYNILYRAIQQRKAVQLYVAVAKGGKPSSSYFCGVVVPMTTALAVPNATPINVWKPKL